MMNMEYSLLLAMKEVKEKKLEDEQERLKHPK